MATYLEIHTLDNNDDLRNKVEVAVVKKAQTLLDLATPSVAQVAWAETALANPRSKAESILRYVWAANSELSTVQIRGASDAAIQTNVNAAVDKLIG